MPKNSQVLIDIGQGLSMLVGLPILDSWDNARRPTKAKPGTFGFNFQTKSLEYWDGTAWFSASMIAGGQ